MPIAMTTTGVHHVALRSTDLARSRRFYADTLGFPIVLDTPAIFLFLAGQTAVAVRGPEMQTPDKDVFSPFRAGLDHLALACADERELERVAAALAAANVENAGIKLDPTLNRRYVAFKDPDRIAWELYMAPNANLAAVSMYIDGLRRKNVDEAPLAPDVRFEGPLGPPLCGAAAVRDSLRSVFPILTGVRVQQMLNDGDQVAVRSELDTVHGVVQAFDWFRLVDGVIVEVRPYYDPRPMALPSDATSHEPVPNR
jgi:catechol 2,3-dioxygenase-like lactoylglutathione lyase family enzyme